MQALDTINKKKQIQKPYEQTQKANTTKKG